MASTNPRATARPRPTPDRPADPVDLDALRGRYFRRLGLTRTDLVFYTYIEDRAFVRAVRSGRAPSPGFGDALVAHAVVDAAYRSADLGGPVDITER